MKTFCVAGIASLAMAVVLLGCGGHDEDAGGGHHMDQMPHDAGGAGAATLSAADKTLMEAQATCPVSGEDLTSQEAPVKLDYEGKTVFFCCEDCVAQFKKSPAKYLAKLKH